MNRSSPGRGSSFTAAGWEAAAWLGPALAFLAIYVLRFGGAATAFVAHLQVVLLLMTVTMAARCVLHAVAGRRTAVAVGSLVTASTLVLLWAYYVLALAGFGAWGYLVSWGLISAYLHQARHLVEVLGHGVLGMVAGVLLLLLAVLIVVYRHLRREDWVARAGAQLTRGMAPALACILLGIAAIFFWRFVEFPPTELGEPLALTFNPASFERKFQSHFLTQSKHLAQEEEVIRKSYPAPQRRPSTNVILIVVDGMRARNMGVYGYVRPTTPFLSDLAAAGRLTGPGRAHSVCAESSCGLMAIASSRYVHQFVADPFTLTQVLRLNGYQIHMVLGGDHTNFYGLRKMYGDVDTYFDGSMNGAFYINDDAAIVEALRRLKPRAAHSNFIQLHLMSNHVLARRDGAGHFGEQRNYYAATSEFALSRPSPGDIPKFVNFYDAGVMQSDQAIRSVLAVLREKGLMEDALVVVTADHGEYVGERNRYGHAKGVHGEVLDVPLLLMTSDPQRPIPADKGQLASQIDIAPTVLAHLGLPIPRNWQGMPLQTTGIGAPAPRTVYFQQGSEFGLTARQPGGRTWKYWVDVRSGEEFAFALDDDPLETSNRIGEIAETERAKWRAALLPLEVNVRESAGVP